MINRTYRFTMINRTYRFTMINRTYWFTITNRTATGTNRPDSFTKRLNLRFYDNFIRDVYNTTGQWGKIFLI